MSESSPTVSDLYKAKIITDDDVNRVVRVAIDGARDKATLADGYAVDLGTAVQANDFAARVLADSDSKPGARQNAARTAVLLARVEKA